MKRNGSTLTMPGRALGMLAASALAVGGTVALAGPAAAAQPTCGSTVTSSVGLMSDIGPCTGNGIIVGADGVSINLNGHTILGNNTANATSTEQVGILIMGHRNVQVRNGTVANFDAGIAVVKGSKNTVSNINAHDNINHSSLTGANNKCKYGDGITVTGSGKNIIKDNTVMHNGPFSGISLVGASSDNIVSGNTATFQTVSNELPPAGSGNNGPCGPFSATPTGQGRLHQDIGIRVEGPGALNNQVLSNTSSDNQLNGISIHGYVCLNGLVGPPPNVPKIGTANTGNLIQGNDVRRNGFPDGLDGIGILSQGPLGTVTCGSSNNSIIGNTSIGNAGSGIYVTRTGDNTKTSSNTISQNLVNFNGVDGIRLQGPNMVCPLGAGNSGPPNFTCNVPLEPRNGANNNTLVSNRGTGNGTGTFTPPNVGDDGYDGNPNCDNNFWQQNIFGTVNQACVAAHLGTGTVTGPPIP